MPATVMADPQTSLMAPIPVNTPAPANQNTAANNEPAPAPTPAPAKAPVATQPKETTLTPVIPGPPKNDPNFESSPKDPTIPETSSTQPAQSPEQPSVDPTMPSDSVHTQSSQSNNAGPGDAADLGTPKDPNQASSHGPAVPQQSKAMQSPDDSNGNLQITAHPGVNQDESQVNTADPAPPANTKPTPHSGSNNGDTQKAADPGKISTQPDNSLPNYDPSNVSPDQMSQLDNALTPGHQASAAPGQNTPEQQNSSSGTLPYADKPQQSGNDPPKAPSQNAPEQQNNPEGTAKTPSQDNPQQKDDAAGGFQSPNKAQAPNDSLPEATGQATPQQQNPPAASPPSDKSQQPNNGSPEGPAPNSHKQQYNSPESSPALPATMILVASHAVVVEPSGVHVDGSKVQSQEGPVSFSGGAAINYGNSIVLGSQIYNIPNATPAPTTVIAGHVVSPVANGAVINGNTITKGAAAVTVSGTPVSVDSSNQIHIDNSPYQLPATNPAPTITLPNGAAAAVASNGVSVHGTTITAGASAVTISGTPVSLDFSQNLIYGGTAVGLASYTASLANPVFAVGQVTTVNNQPVVQLTNGVSIAGTTLTPGAPAIAVSGTRIALGSSALVIGSSSVAYAPPGPASDSLVTTIAGQEIKANPSAVVLESATLMPGASGVVIGGTPVALDTAGGLVVGSSTVALGSASLSTGLGGLILSGLGAGGMPSTMSPSLTPANSSIPTGTQGAARTTTSAFTGGASHLARWVEWKMVVVMVMVITMMSRFV